MEITLSINKYRILSEVVYAFLKSIFYFIRIIVKPIAYKDGNIIVITLRKLGDTVFTIPAIKEIQKFYNKRIIIFCFPEVVPICKLALTDVDYCEVDHKYFYFNGRIANRKARKILKASKPKTIFDLTGVMTSATLIFNSRAKEIIGMNREQFKTIYDYHTPIRSTPNLMDMYIDSISPIISNIDREKIKTFPIKINGKGKIMIHPLAGWKAKEWNFNKFINLAIKLSQQYNVSFVLPTNEISIDIIIELQEKKIDVIQPQSVEELIQNIKLCSIFIGNDSGPLYIASLLGKPTFTIYGPTNWEYSHPSGLHHKFIKKDLKCSPKKNEQYCFTFAGLSGCPAFECMNLLEFDDVYDEVLTFVQKNFS